jgi:hypothetical protein
MKRFGWLLLILVVAVAGAGFRWLAPRNTEFSIVDIDLLIGGGEPSDPTRNVLADDGGNEEARGLSAEFDASKDLSAPRSGCFDQGLIRGARVVALGAYEGAEPISLSFAGEAHEVSRIVVQGNKDGPPLLLVLTAYDPVMWDFADFPIKRLRGLIVYGHTEQAVAHVNESIPVRFATSETGETRCGTAIYAYKQSRDLERLRMQVKSVLGVPLNAFYGSYSPDALHVDGASYKSLTPVRLDRASLRASGPLLDGGLLPAEQGIRQLIERGDIRPARSSDWTQWQRVSGEKPDTFLDGYVVLRRTELPRGMYGAHSRAFLIPAGVPLPSDPGSHNRYYRLKDGTCVSCL